MNKWRIHRGDHDGHCSYQCLKCKGYIRATYGMQYDNWKFCPLCGTQWEGEHKWEKPYYEQKRQFHNHYRLEYKSYIDWEWLGEGENTVNHWQGWNVGYERKDVLERAKCLLDDHTSSYKGSVVEVRILYVTEKGEFPTGIHYKRRTEVNGEGGFG